MSARPPSAFKWDALAADRGNKIWNSKGCGSCHAFGKSQLSGPDLTGFAERRSVEWLHRWLKNPLVMTSQDSTAIAMKLEYRSQMPDFGLTDEDADALIHYFVQQTQERRQRN